MRANASAYSLVELIVGIALIMGIAGAFAMLIRQTAVFVEHRKQELVTVNSMDELRSEIRKHLDRPGAALRPDGPPESAGFSVKDEFGSGSAKVRDVAVFEIPLYAFSGGRAQYSSGLVAVAIVSKTTGKPLSGLSDEDGFFAVTEVSSGARADQASFTGGYVNRNLNAKSFSYRSDGSYSRLEFSYDNDVDGEYRKNSGSDEYFFSGSSFIMVPAKPDFR